MDIELTWIEIKPVARILNEVCHGIPINDFEEDVGYSYDTIYALLKKIKRYKPENETEPVHLVLSAQEVDILKKSYKAVIKELEEWDFPIRVGITLEEAEKLFENFR